MLFRTHPGFDETWLFPVGKTAFEMGQNLWRRVFMRSEFDINENVAYQEIDPNNLRNIRYGRAWTRCQYNDLAQLEFPNIEIRNLSMVTQGPYQITQAQKYITNIREQEVQDLLERDFDVEWEDNDLLCGMMPEPTVHFTDVLMRPINWDDEAFGLWCPRRYVVSTFKSLHVNNQTERVIISYIPISWDLGDNFQNRFGFDTDDLERILGWGCLDPHCKPGYRVAGCDSHVASLMMMLGIYAYNPDLFISAHQNVHLISMKNPDSLNIDIFKN